MRGMQFNRNFLLL